MTARIRDCVLRLGSADRLMGVKIPQGSVHTKGKALIDAVSMTKWRLKAKGAEQELFGKKVILGLEEGTQAR